MPRHETTFSPVTRDLFSRARIAEEDKKVPLPGFEEEYITLRSIHAARLFKKYALGSFRHQKTVKDADLANLLLRTGVVNTLEEGMESIPMLIDTKVVYDVKYLMGVPALDYIYFREIPANCGKRIQIGKGFYDLGIEP